MTRVYISAADAVADIPDGASLAVGGFGCAAPRDATDAPLTSIAEPAARTAD